METAEAETVEALAMAGDCSSGAERRRGRRWHAVPRASGFTRLALCGARPSVQWGGELGSTVTCPRCLARMRTGGGEQ